MTTEIPLKIFVISALTGDGNEHTFQVYDSSNGWIHSLNNKDFIFHPVFSEKSADRSNRLFLGDMLW